MKGLIETTAEKIATANKVVALTGAGISVDSGIPAFRGAQGLWDRYDPMEYATIHAFLSNPVKVWKMLRELGEIVGDAKPNAGHLGLAELETLGKLSSVVTQNVDGLHQAAGNSCVIEFHGNGRKLVCLSCKRKYDREDMPADAFPPMCACLNILKPDVVFFGEMIPMEAFVAAQAEAEGCDVMMVVGTSAQVEPAASLPYVAKSHGATIVEVNPEPTPLTHTLADIAIHESATTAMPVLAAAVRKLLQQM
ncbi:MAG: NAD-dependent deacylase [Candidatus Abyssobacteria bacterium SURF_17]|uniref:protein acetyllysine N-acetyltransferase n=1 Tax=Candidatus Abyssobacteria bacterium SURF_17 TaxID=2093361 RepID=A0A419ERC6_9BACT|nr:MAG: NAD-dependent deacylase [Candidatus Abyssubacteria bacterium SURF_17]